jgi:putative holliday junction resolvase
MRWVGLDVGRRRVGIAVSDSSGILARPLRTISVTGSPDQTAEALAMEIERLSQDEDGMAGIVVGLPTRLDGTPHELTAHVLAAVERLRARTAWPVHLQDERLSSREAESRLALREPDWRKRKEKLDAASAAVILQDYLDAQVTRR